MHYSHRLSSGRLAQIVGTFVLIPVLILAVAGFWMSKTEHLFEPKYHLLASLSKSYGLEPGAPVVVSGIRVGRVKRGGSQRSRDGRSDAATVGPLPGHGEGQFGTAYYQKQCRGQPDPSRDRGGYRQRRLTDGAIIRAVEPRDIGDLLNEVEPVLMAVKQTLLRVETITQDLQGGLKAGGKFWSRWRWRRRICRRSWHPSNAPSPRSSKRRLRFPP